MIPGWTKEQRPGKPPLDARCEGTNGMFLKAYASRRYLIPLDGFFEWRKSSPWARTSNPKQSPGRPASRSRSRAIWESWRIPATGEDICTFCVVTCAPNEMMATIHDPIPVILHREDYERWLSPQPNPYNLMKQFPAELMIVWPIHRKVGSPKNGIRHPRSPEPAE